MSAPVDIDAIERAVLEGGGDFQTLPRHVVLAMIYRIRDAEAETKTYRKGFSLLLMRCEEAEDIAKSAMDNGLAECERLRGVVSSLHEWHRATDTYEDCE